MKRVWYPGKKPTFQMSEGVPLSPGWNRIADEEVANRLLASGLVRTDECATCDELPRPRESDMDPHFNETWRQDDELPRPDNVPLSQDADVDTDLTADVYAVEPSAKDEATTALEEVQRRSSESGGRKGRRKRKRAGGGASTKDGGA